MILVSMVAHRLISLTSGRRSVHPHGSRYVDGGVIATRKVRRHRGANPSCWQTAHRQAAVLCVMCAYLLVVQQNLAILKKVYWGGQTTLGDPVISIPNPLKVYDSDIW